MTKLTTGWQVNEKRTNCEEQRDSNSNETRVLVSVSMYCEGNLKSYGSLPFNLSTVSRHDGTLFVFCCVIQSPNTTKNSILFNFKLEVSIPTRLFALFAKFSKSTKQRPFVATLVRCRKETLKAKRR